MSAKKVIERKKSVSMRLSGMSVNDIARTLGVSKSSVSIWVRDTPVPERFTTAFRDKRKADRLKRVSALKKKRKLKPRIISGDGRWMIRAPKGYKGKTYIGARYVYEHRYVTEQFIGRLLVKGEVVHHINGDKLDNRISNLELFTNSSHSKHHGSDRSVTLIDLKCAYCGKSFSRENRAAKTGQTDFYCNRSCMAHHFGRGRGKN